MHTETRYNGVSDVLVLVADNDKLIRRKGTESVAEEVYLGISYFVDGVRQDPPHQDVPEDLKRLTDLVIGQNQNLMLTTKCLMNKH